MDPLHGKTVLLVEDEPIIALDERMLLERYGLAVVPAATGEAAVEIVETRDDIDLVLMDINLGEGIDGTLAAQRILGIREVPVIFLSSHTEREVVERTEGITSYGYIVKNSGETVLIASIKMAFRLHAATESGRRHERALRDERDRARLYLAIAGVVMVALDTEGRVTMINDQGCEILGYSREELLGEDWFATCVPECVAAERRRTYTSVIAGNELLEALDENIVRTKSGERRILFWRHTVVRDESGTVIGALSSGQDVTERVVADRLLRKQRELSALLSEISASFIEQPVAALEDNMNAALEEICRFLELDLCGLLSVVDGMVEIDNFWFAGEPIALSTAFSVVDAPILMQSFVDGAPHHWNLGESAALTAVERSLLEESGVQELATIPINIAGEIVSCVGFANYRTTGVFTDELMAELVRLGRVFAAGIARRQAQERLEEISANAPGVVFQFHLSPDGQMRFPYVGHGATEQYGIEASALAENPSYLGRRVRAEDLANFWARVTESAENLSQFRMVHRFYDDKQEVRWMDVRSTPRRLPDGSTLWNGIAVDVTAQKEAEAALEEQARFAQAIGDSLSALVYLYDLDEMRNVWSNRAHREFFSRIVDSDPGTIARDDILRFVHPDDLPKLLAEAERVTSDPTVSFVQLELRFAQPRQVDADDDVSRWVWVFLSLTPFARRSDGSVRQIMGSLVDISQRVTAERALQEMVAERDVLLREVNHRVKNNLLMVSSLLTLREAASDVDLSDVKNQVDAIGAVHELLHAESTLTEIDIETYVGRILKAAFGADVQTSIRTDGLLLPAAKSVPFGLLVNELATNASRHGFVGGEPREFSLAVEKIEGDIVLTAENSGVWFPDEVDPATATTLGLRLISGLVKQLGGRLQLDRDPQTRFTVTFPHT